MLFYIWRNKFDFKGWSILFNRGIGVCVEIRKIVKKSGYLLVKEENYKGECSFGYCLVLLVIFLLKGF